MNYSVIGLKNLKFHKNIAIDKFSILLIYKNKIHLNK